MRYKLILFTLLFFNALYSQKKVEPKVVKSRIFKGSIQGQPITMFLEDGDIIDCYLYGNYIKGWYYYDKYKIKIPLSGYSGEPDFCDMKLYNFGKNHHKTANLMYSKSHSGNIDSIFSKSKYTEQLSFDRCWYETDKKNSWKGTFKTQTKKAEIIINADDLYITKYYDYFTFPNGNKVNLIDVFGGHQGNEFYSMTEGKTENRIIFYYNTAPNSNFCGQCGADFNYGYHVLYFDKNWNIKKGEKFPVYNCFTNTFPEKIYQNENGAKYLIEESYDGGEIIPPYYIIVDKKKSTIKNVLKKKIK